MGIVTSRRTVLGLLAAGTASVAAPWVVRPAMAQSKTVNITTYDGFLPPEFVEKFQKDTGIAVNVRLTDDQGKQYNLLTAEGAAPSTDLVTVTGHRLSQFIAGNLLAPLDTARLKNWGNLASPYAGAPQITADGSVYGVPLLAGFEAMARNTDYTKPSDSWGMMFDPEYKGLTTYILSDMVTIVMKYLGDDGDFVTYDGKPDVAKVAIDKAQAFLIEHKNMVRKYYDAGSEVQQMLINEDAYVAQCWSGPVAKLIMDGHPVEISIPKEGTYGFIYSFNVVNNAPNADAAYALLDAIMADPEVGAAMTRASGFSSTMAGVDQVLNDRERAALTVPPEQLERIQFFSAINRDMKNSMIDAAVSAIKAA